MRNPVSTNAVPWAMPDEERFPEPPSDDEIKRRFSELRDQLAADPELMRLVEGDPLEEKKQELQEKVSAARPVLPEVPEWNAPRNPFAEKRVEEKKDHDAYGGLGVGLSVAYAVIGFPFIGVGVGYFFDKYLHTDPNGMGAGCFIGLALALWFAIRTLNRLENK